MGFFKDMKQDTNKTSEETAKKENSDTLEELNDQKQEESKKETEDFIDENMYKDILAAAEQLLTEDDDNDSQELNSIETSSQEGSKLDDETGSLKEINSSQEATLKETDDNQETMESETKNMGTDVNKEEEKVENTMVDYDENAVDSEILDTLLKDEEKTEKSEHVEEKTHEVNPELTKEDKEAVTVITRGTTINGSIISDCSLDVMGTINGDIECLGKLSISGKVVGNSMASEVYVNTDRLEGSISSEGSVKVGVGTVVIGDITATSGVIAGAVKGEIDVSGPVVIDSTAIIKGNIKAKTVQMNNGAVVEGFCSLSYSDVDINNIFE